MISIAAGIALISVIYYFTSKRPGSIPQIGSIINKQHIFVKNNESKDALIVFCHGFGGQIPLFEHQLEYFQKDYSVLAIDYTGHGKTAESDNLEDYTAAAFAAQVKHAIEAYSLPGQKVVLVGHSYGCIVSTKLANQFKNLNVAALVLLAPFGFIDELELAKFHTISTYPTVCLDFYRKFIDRFGGLNSISVSRAIGRNVPEHIREKQYSYNCSTKTATVKKTLAGFRVFSGQEYKDLKIPVMIISGALDRVCKLENNGARMKAIISPDLLSEEHFQVLPFAGHQVMLEAPKEVNELIKKFLEDINL